MKELLGIKTYNVKEISSILHVSEPTVRRYVHLGVLRAQRIGGRLSFTEDNLREFVNGQIDLESLKRKHEQEAPKEQEA
jgi:excisionase family DNA binding protein